MANWFYYDASGRKFGPVDGATLKQLALHGVVRPETVLETEAGQRGAAGTLQGLEFGAGTAPPPPPVQNNTPPAGFGAGASMPVPPPMPQAQNVPTPPQTQNSVSPPVSQYENPTLQSRNRLLARLEGVGGSVLEVYEEKVVIVRPATWTNVSLHGVKGDKTLYYSKMTGLQLKKQGVAVGYIQFTIPGGNESRGGVFDAVKDENTLAFAKRAFQPSPNPLAQAIHDYIESRILGHPSDPQRYFGSFDFTQKEKAGCLSIIALLIFWTAVLAMLTFPLGVVMALSETSPMLLAFLIIALVALTAGGGFFLWKNPERREALRPFTERLYAFFTPATPTRRLQSGCLIYVVLFAALTLLGLCGLLPDRPDSDTPESSTQAVAEKEEPAPVEKAKPAKPDKISKLDAMFYAEEAVKNCLKHKHDAKFGWSKTAVEREPSPPFTMPLWVVTGTVKAPNDFGAMLTYEYRVIVTGTSKSWKIASVEFNNKFVYVDSEFQDK